MTATKSNTIIFVETAKQENLRAAPLVVPRRCRPFSLSVMVYSPQAGYKIEIEIEKNCNPNNEAVWKFVFNLSKKNEQGALDVLVSVKFTANSPEEEQGIVKITKEGLTESQFEGINKDIYSLTKSLGEEGRNPSPKEEQKLDASVRQIVTSKV